MGRLRQLNTNDIRHALRTDAAFIGVFPLDRLPRGVGKIKTIKLVANLQPANLPGSHWVAIYRCGGKGYYFDTFGEMPPHEIQCWLAANTLTWDYNRRIVQSKSDDASCGYICIYFLKKL